MENEASATPVNCMVSTGGPWVAVPFNGEQWAVQKSNCDLHFICITSQENDEANARLIAAAPDLLECAKSMLAEYEEGRSPRYDIREMCRAAIAKSKGESYEL